MQKKFRRLSFALAALLCLQGFCAAEDWRSNGDAAGGYARF